MSQHYFSFRDGVVTAGWDRTLACFFLTVEGDCSDDPLYSDSDDPRVDRLNAVPYFETVLARMDITPPPGFWKAVARDRISNAGNRCRDWGTVTLCKKPPFEPDHNIP